MELIQLFSLIVFIVGISGQSTPYYCNVYLDCLPPISLAELGNKILPDEEFLNKYCSSLISSVECFLNLLPICGSRDVDDVEQALKMSTIVQSHLTELCDVDSETREGYLASIPCINSHRERYNQCILNTTRVTTSFMLYLRLKEYDEEEVELLIKCTDFGLLAACGMVETRNNCNNETADFINHQIGEIYREVDQELCPEELFLKYRKEFYMYARENPDNFDDYMAVLFPF